MNWQPSSLAPTNELVWTKICDDDGERNVQKLIRRGNLWHTHEEPDKGMYVYYTPTHWCRG